ncbi:MAG: Hsp70 family protein [Myxococcota bacterium]
MSETTPRSARGQFDSRVRLIVEGVDELRERYAANLSSGGLFIRDEAPPPVGSRVLIEFVLPDGHGVCRVLGQVIHSKPGMTHDDPTAGMGLRFIQLDDAAKKLAHHFQKTATNTRRAPPPPRPITVSGEGPVVGIDLGTVNSCVAVVDSDEPRVVVSDKGYETIPSIVHYDADTQNSSVGHAAQERMILDPFRAVYGSKRFLGRAYRSTEVQALGHFFHYPLVEGPDGRVIARINEQEVPLENVAAQILSELVELASQSLGRSVKRAVVTVPAYFGESQRAATVAAGRIAGIKIERLINEPTAAAIAFGTLRHETDMTVLAYDLGGGTFDASLLRIEGRSMRVLASEGDPFLGGTDFDDRLIQYLLFGFEREHGIDLRDDPVAIQRIRFAVELAKRQLTSAKSASIHVPYVTKKNGAAVDVSTHVTQDLFVSLTQDLVDRTLSIVQRALDSAQLKASDIDELILVGGQSRSPHVSESLRARFGRAPSKRVHPDHAVALGAALVAYRAYGSQTPAPKQPKPSPKPSPSSAPTNPAGNAEPLLRSPDTNAGDHVIAPVAMDLKLSEIVTASLHLVLPNGSLRTLFPQKTPLPAEREVYLAPSSRSATEYVVVLVRGEHTNADLNEPVCSVRVPTTLASSLAGSKLRVWVRLNEDGQLNLIAEHPETGYTEELNVSIR